MLEKGVMCMMGLQKLPEAEYELMEIIWQLDPPVNTALIHECIKRYKMKEWKPQTVLTLLNRMERRGFLCSQKIGKERLYTPLIERDEYLRFETASFMERFHKNSFASFVGSMYKGKEMKSEDLNELEDWLSRQEE